MFVREENGIYYNSAYLAGDILALQGSLLLAFLLRRLFKDISGMESYFLFGISIIFTTFLVAFFSENYKGICKRGYYLEFIKSFQLVSLVCFLELVRLFIFRDMNTFSRGIVLFWYVTGLVSSYLIRCFLKKMCKERSERGKTNVLLLITDARHISHMNEYIENKAPKKYSKLMFGVLGKIDKGYKCCENCLLGENEILNYALSEVVDEVLITHIMRTEKVEALAQNLLSMGITVHFDVYKAEEGLNIIFPNKFGEVNVLTSCSSYVSERDLFLKRMMDITGAVVGLMIALPIFIIVAPIIYITSPGPIFFKQKRVGRNGRIFTLYKLRSMYMDAEERKKELMKHNQMDGLMFKMENDPRITPIGKFIRKTSIDELPQFWNVLIGDMSLVGTRPPTVDEYEKYEKHHKARLAMKPGITGMWQVSGRSDITNFEQVVALDREYIHDWNIGKDIRLILKTIKVVFLSKGAR